MITLRRAEPEDAEVLGKVLQDWLDATPWMPDLHSLAETQRFVGRLIADQDVTVATAGGPVGFLARAGDWVNALYVAQDFRGQGMGAALLGAAQAQVPSLQLWTFQANAGARAFYARHGFGEARRTEGDNQEGLPDVLLTWTATERITS